MSRSRPWPHLPRLILALLAMALVLGRAPAEPGPPTLRLAGIAVALCHTGGKPDQPKPAGCDTCVLCVALHAAVPILPVGAALPAVSLSTGIALPPRGARASAAPPIQGPWARAPPMAA